MEIDSFRCQSQMRNCSFPMQAIIVNKILMILVPTLCYDSTAEWLRKTFSSRFATVVRFSFYLFFAYISVMYKL